MGYVDFETDNAFYRLHLTSHGGWNKPNGFRIEDKDILENFDAHIQELVGSEEKGLIAEFAETEAILGVDDSIKTWKLVLEQGIPVFFPDIKSKSGTKVKLGKITAEGLISFIGLGGATHAALHFKKMSRSQFLIKASASLTAFTVGLLSLNSTHFISLSGPINASRYLQSYESFICRFFAEAIVEGRNAINAEKIDRFIALWMGLRLGRKPKLQLIYGTGHVGLEHCLKDAAYRKEVMKRFNPPEEFYYPENMYDCLELTFPDPKIPFETKIVQHKNIISFPQLTEKDMKDARARLEQLEARMNQTNQKQIRTEPLDRRSFLKMLTGRG